MELGYGVTKMLVDDDMGVDMGAEEEEELPGGNRDMYESQDKIVQ